MPARRWLEGRLQQCTGDETKAREQLQTQWTQFGANDKTNYTRETSADGTGSYVELLTCLEMARDVKK